MIPGHRRDLRYFIFAELFQVCFDIVNFFIHRFLMFFRRNLYKFQNSFESYVYGMINGHINPENNINNCIKIFIHVKLLYIKHILLIESDM